MWQYQMCSLVLSHARLQRDKYSSASRDSRVSRSSLRSDVEDAVVATSRAIWMITRAHDALAKGWEVVICVGEMFEVFFTMSGGSGCVTVPLSGYC